MNAKSKQHFAVSFTAIALAAVSLSGCGIQQIRNDQQAMAADAQSKLNSMPKSRPVVQVHEGAWLMGEKVRATKSQPEIYSKQVTFNSTLYSLSDFSNWIVRTVGVRAIVDPSAYAPLPGASTVGATAAARPGVAPQAAAGGRSVDLNSPLPGGSVFGNGVAPFLAAGTSLQGGQGAAAASGAAQPLTLRYTGTLRGLVDRVNAHFAVWDRYEDGTVTLFRTETRNFDLPAISDASTMSGAISTDSSSTGAGAGNISASSSAGGQNGQTGAGSTGGGGQNMSVTATVNPWLSLQDTARSVAGAGAEVIVDKNLGLLTVTGTPQQCDRVEGLVRKLEVMYGKQVGIDVALYSIRLTREHNLGATLNLSLASPNGHTGLTFSGATPPTMQSSASPMKFGATIVGGRLNGTSAAVQALSALGDVSQVVTRGGVTTNGKVLALQSATPRNYVSQTQTTLASNVGSTTSIQTSTLVPGFTANFLPKVINGRISVNFSMTLSQLLELPTFSVGGGSNQTSVQLPTLQLARFEQSVNLKPGESLVLTSSRQQSASVNANGVGSPFNPLLGGGVDAQQSDTILAIVVSARLL